MKYTHILWDFNGTIINDVETGIVSLNTLLKRRNMPTIDSVEQYHSVFTFPITKYYENVGFDFSVEPYDKLAIEWVKENEVNIRKARLCDGAREALEYFKDKGIPQIVISATEVNMLRGHIEHLGITDYFEEILGLDNIHAESKVGLGVDWLKRHPGAAPLMIGDTVHDAEVAKSIGCDCVLCSTGHQSLETISRVGVPTFVNLEELIKGAF